MISIRMMKTGIFDRRMDHMDYEPEEDLQEQEKPDLPLIDIETFYDLLMEEQKQI